MAELEGLGPNEGTKVEIEWLDYDYVAKCKDVTKIKLILDTLKSGKEGFYPELEQFTEDRWLSLLPDGEKNRILRMRQKPTAADISLAENDLVEWEQSIQETDKKLRDGEERHSNLSGKQSIFTSSGTGSSKKALPPVRGTQSTTVPIASSSNSSSSSSSSQSKGKSSKSKEPSPNDPAAKRISGYDFRAWERFDADAAAEAVESDEQSKAREEERKNQSLRDAALRSREEAERRREQIHQQELEDIRSQLSSSSMSDIQIQLKAGREKQKGNEQFRAGELEAAYNSYTRSLALDSTNAAVYANRAVVGLKLDRLDATEDDCTRALELDREYLKAWSRRGLARFKKGKYAEAASDFKAAIARDPNNSELHKLYASAKNKFSDVEGRPLMDDDIIEAVRGPSLLSQRSTTTSSTQRQHSSELSDVIPGALECVPAECKRLDDLESYLGSDEAVLVSAGVCELVKNTPGKEFTRVQIVVEDDDDDDDDDDDNEGESAGVHAGSGFSRIAITEEEEDDDEPEENSGSTIEDGQRSEVGFTRVAITEDSEDEESCDGVARSEEAVAEKELGNRLMSQGKHEEAIVAYTKAIDASLVVAESNSVEGKARLSAAGLPLAAWNNRAMAYLAMKKFELASNDSSRVLTNDPNNLKALYRSAVCHKELGELTLAEEQLKRLLQLDDKNAPAAALLQSILDQKPAAVVSEAEDESTDEWKCELVRREALRHLNESNQGKAIEILTNGINDSSCGDSSSKTSLRMLLGTTCITSGNYKLALEQFDAVLSLDRSNFKALVKRGHAKLKLGDLDGARTDALTALRIDSSDTEAMALLDSVEVEKEALLKSKSPPEVVQSPEARVQEAVNQSASRSNDLKEMGNEAMKKEDFKKAVDLYTESIAVDPTNLLSYNNRAQAYLKMSKYVDAERDASHVIEQAPKQLKGDGAGLVNKALFRRASSRRCMGGSNLASALADFDALLAVDPNNASFKKEREKTHLLCQEWEKSVSKAKSVAPPPTTAIPKQSASLQKSTADVVGLTAVSTKKRDVAQVPASTVESTTAAEVSSKSDAQREPEPSTSQSTTPTKTTSKSKPVSGSKKSTPSRSPEVPSEPPKTLYELERVWRGLKERPELFAQYLSVFKKSTFKKVMNESISHDLIASMLRALRDHAQSAVIATVLEGWSLSSGFGMTLRLLPEEDLQCLQALFVKMTLDKEFCQSFDKLGVLQSTYGISKSK